MVLVNQDFLDHSMAILNLPTFIEQAEKTPEQKMLESLQQMQIERPQAEDGIRDRSPSRGLGDVYKRQSTSH